MLTMFRVLFYQPPQLVVPGLVNLLLLLPVLDILPINMESVSHPRQVQVVLCVLWDQYWLPPVCTSLL